MYKILSPWAIQKLDDGTSFPINPDNTDYQQYLAWVEAGNKPEPADKGAK